MRQFTVSYTGDFCDENQCPIGDLATELLDPLPWLRYDFLRDLGPSPGDEAFRERLYELEINSEHIRSKNALIICRPYLRESVFVDGAEDFVAVGRAGIGVDKLDIDACTANDVVVFNAPHGLVHSTASAALLFILALAKKLPTHDRIVRTGRWDLQKDAVGDDLTGMCLGIVGLGNTGRELARLVTPFAMEVISFSPHADPNEARRLDVELVPTLNELLVRADYVSLHNRLTKETRKMMGREQFARMKPTAHFINVARGEQVDQSALADALRNQSIAGAALDVYEAEPLPLGDPLLSLDNVILTPHWIPTTHRSGRLTMESVVRGIIRVSQGEVPESVLNREVLTRPGFVQKLERYGENGK